jgi:arylsulfatase A-like enzyme
MKLHKLFLLLIFISGPLFTASAQTERPNVLFIAVDDMNDWVGCLKSGHAITPNIDRLADRGVNFTNAHTAGSYCAPSRAAILTGQYASTTGIYKYQTYHALYPELVPLQSSFKAAGYETFGAGKLYHHQVGSIDLRDWSEFFVRSKRQRKSGWPLDSWSSEIPKPEQGIKDKSNKGAYERGSGLRKWGALPNDQEEEMADAIRTKWAVSKLKEKHNKPFFLGLGIYAPHLPNYAPQKYYDLYDRNTIPMPVLKDDDYDDLPEPMRTKMKNRTRGFYKTYIESGLMNESVHSYLASISFADAMIGRVLDALEASPYADNTIVVLWSDNGFHYGEKGHYGKKQLWQRTSNIPFVWAGPGVAKGQSPDVTVSLIDMYPTFVEMCDLPKPKHTLEGISLAATLKKPKRAKDRNVYLPFIEPNAYAIINKQWRYIKYANDTEELYSVEEDHNEWFNLAEKPEYASIKKSLRDSAPKTFAKPAPNHIVKRDLVIKGESYHWKTKK